MSQDHGQTSTSNAFRGPETEKSHQTRIASGFYQMYMSGYGLDIGYRGSLRDARAVLDTAVGVDLDYPGYDGLHLPFAEGSQDYVFASHVLEHIFHYGSAIVEWFRVLRTGGHLVICVPHKYLYERRSGPPSRWNEDHKRFYTPSGLLREIELALAPNCWRLRHLRDNDDNYDYSVPLDKHPGGSYEIECVIQKIKPPTWRIE